MSLWTRIRDTVVGVAAPIVGAALGGPIGAAIATGAVARRSTGATLPQRRLPGPVMPGVGQVGFPAQSFVPGAVIPSVIRAGTAVLKSPAVRAGAAAAAGAILGDTIVPDGNGGTVRLVTRRKYRRMNPCNPKALRRAVRRLSAYHKQNKKIEVQLRKLAPPRRAARRYSPPHRP